MESRKRFLTILFFLLYVASWDGSLHPGEDRSLDEILTKVYEENYVHKNKNIRSGTMWMVAIQYAREIKTFVTNCFKSITRSKYFYASGKVIYGMKDDRDFSIFSHFCYSNSRRSKEKGVVILTSLFIPKTKFLISNQTEEEMYNNVHKKDGNTCEDLEKKSLFVHTFNATSAGYLDNSYFIYEKDIDDNLRDTKLNFALLNCGQEIKNAYKIEFRNNDNFLRNHFSCEDQGLIEIHILLVMILGVLSLVYKKKEETLRQANNALKESLHVAVLFFFFSNLLYLIHLFVYAFNGSGFTILKVLSQIFESIYDCFIVSIIFYVMCCTHDKNKRREDTFRNSLVYSMFKFTYVLFEVQNQQDLNLYASLSSVVALPFVAYRFFIAVLIYNNCKKLMKEKTYSNEKFSVLFEAFLYNLWIMSIPMYYLLMTRASVHFTHLFVHFSNLLILIYLVHIISEKKYEELESRNPYLDME
ncbi:hypothetical protein, conserved [Plasmodium gonderi]|uniref:Uncharacterized protein n=1 Tax=Plasmodium gonderi TaxID=77519 RepID=A0A1Y1JHC9_PLAGO|nr:hypothetical protein, conserved [Plasmodium gonderi]GAW79843.1 hypothetical protein, conserved [Plasmodium gonderi]